jgi:maltooligosyltrehalose trehalohydrolase
MLFQGQEYSSSAPFLYFADHHPELNESIRRGRREFLGQFPSLSDSEIAGALPPPIDESTFWRCKLDLSERETHAAAYALHRDLLELRRSDPTIREPRRIDGAVIGPEAFVLRYFGQNADRLLLVNLGCDFEVASAPEPLLAPPAGARWTPIWSSESVRYGGQGTAPLRLCPEWRVPGQAAVLLGPVDAPTTSRRGQAGQRRAGAADDHENARPRAND